MKTVLPNPAHLWAHQSQSHARNAGKTFWFEGTSIYSYATEIGRVVTNAQGERRYVLNGGSYGSFTSKQMRAVRQSIEDQDAILTYPNARAYRGDSNLGQAIRDPQIALSEYVGLMADALAKSRRAKAYAAGYLASMDRLSAQASAWAEFFGLEFSVPEELTYSQEELNVAQQNSAEWEAKRMERYADQREREKLAAAEARIKAQEKIDQWLAGQNVSVPYSVTECFMRLSADGETVQTSRGATVPADHVRRAAALVARMVRSGQSYAGVPPIRFGHYSVSSIDAQGNVRVGCHYFTRAEIERFYEVLKAQGGVRDEVVA